MSWIDNIVRSCGVLGLCAVGLAGCSGHEPGVGEEDVATQAEAIYYGTSSGVNFGIVEIYRNGNTSKPCTGYFISRRHIVTSAHCTDSAQYQWYYVRVKTGYNTFTYLKDSTRPDTWISMRQDVAPGWNFASPTAPADTAILTLPATVQSVPPNSQLLRVSTAAPVVNQYHNIWGWGAYAIGPQGMLRPHDLLFGDDVYVTSVAAGRFNATSAWNRLTCVGDSGGPSTRYIGGYYVATGTHRGNIDDPRCASPGNQMIWASTNNKIAWMEGVIRLAYGAGYSCARFGAGADAYMRCF
jgi:hypothetical protein